MPKTTKGAHVIARGFAKEKGGIAKGFAKESGTTRGFAKEKGGGFAKEKGGIAKGFPNAKGTHVIAKGFAKEKGGIAKGFAKQEKQGGIANSSPRGRGGDRQRRATRGSVGTFAGRLPPKGAETKSIVNAIRQEYYDSKEWAKEQNFVWKESINGVFSLQLCWKMMKEIMNGVPADFEQKREMAKNAWRHIVWENFGEVADT